MDEKNTVKSINGIPVEDTEARAAAASKIGKAELGAAVEEALTQAKESGDFKGDKGDPGYTPQKGVDYFDGAKGDPGDDYNLTEADKTEIAEEAADIVDDALSEVIGDPSGAVPAVPGYMALGMTGAAVGMVARIAAVDADGKPTAWEPVEMAGGGSGGSVEWKIVADETIEADVTSWEKTFDESYSNFKIFIYAFSGANVPVNSAWIEINVGQGKRYLGKSKFATNLGLDIDVRVMNGYLITTCKTTSFSNPSGAVADIGWKLATPTTLTETNTLTLYGGDYLKAGARIVIFAEG